MISTFYSRYLSTMACGCIALLMVGQIWAADRYVNPSSPGAYATIGAAIAASGPGDIIYVYPGVYPESVNLANMAAKGDIQLFTVNSAGSPEAGTATIDPGAVGGPGTGSALFNSGLSFPGSITISGFNVISPNTAGIMFHDANAVTLSNVTASLCRADGMSIYNIAGSVVLESCTATGNSGGAPASTGCTIFNVGGNVTLGNCAAVSNNGQGLVIFNVTAKSVTMSACTINRNKIDGLVVFNIEEDVSLSECAVELNEGDGCQIFNVDRNVAVNQCSFNANMRNGLEVFGIKGDVAVGMCTVSDNGQDGIETFNVDKVTSVSGCVSMGNVGNGVSHGNAIAAASTSVTGCIVCGNGNGVELFAASSPAFAMDAKGNWWGNVSGPVHPSNPGGTGDKIIDGANGGAGTAAYNPWIDTVSASAAKNPVTLGRSDVINFVFSGGNGSVFLGEGPGDPGGSPPFTLTTDNGTLTGSDETGSTIHEFISGSNGTSSVTLVPTSTGKATVALAGPCNLSKSITIDITLNSLELFVRQNARTGNYTFAAGDTLVLEYEVDPALGGFNDGRPLDVILAAQIDPGESDQVIALPVTGGPVYVYGRGIRGPTRLNPRNVPRAYNGFAFPPAPDLLKGALNFRIPSGVKKEIAFMGTIVNRGTLIFLSGIEVSNRFEIK